MDFFAIKNGPVCRRNHGYHGYYIWLAHMHYTSTHKGLHLQDKAWRSFYNDTKQVICNDGNDGSGRPSKVTPEIKNIIDAQMHKDDVTTVVQLGAIHARLDISWQRLLPDDPLCQQNQTAGVGPAVPVNRFLDVIHTNETSIQLEHHCRFWHRKRGETPRPNPK